MYKTSQEEHHFCPDKASPSLQKSATMASQELAKRTVKYFDRALNAAKDHDDWHVAAEKFMRSRNLVHKQTACWQNLAATKAESTHDGICKLVATCILNGTHESYFASSCELCELAPMVCLWADTMLYVYHRLCTKSDQVPLAFSDIVEPSDTMPHLYNINIRRFIKLWRQWQ